MSDATDNLTLQLRSRSANDRPRVEESTGEARGPIFDRAWAYDSDSEVGRRIDVFLRRTTMITPPVRLTPSTDYFVWKESILSCAERVRAHFILENKEEVCPTETPKRSCSGGNRTIGYSPLSGIP